MKLARAGAVGSEVPVVSDGRTWFDLTGVTEDIDGQFVAASIPLVGKALADGALPAVSTPTRFGPPLVGIGKIVCVGLNYRDHAAETRADEPAEPILFLKAADTVIGPDDGVALPRGSVKTDYEVELGVVIKNRTSYLGPDDDPLDAVAGYVISHDVSERAYQLERGGQWDKGKNCETFNPLGPWLLTSDEVPDPQALRLNLWVNGERRQEGSTADMIFGVAELIRYISQFMVLYPGDVINTGTPGGVALGRPDTPYLRSGDVVELEISGLGRQRQLVRQG